MSSVCQLHRPRESCHAVVVCEMKVLSVHGSSQYEYDGIHALLSLVASSVYQMAEKCSYQHITACFSSAGMNWAGTKRPELDQNSFVLFGICKSFALRVLGIILEKGLCAAHFFHNARRPSREAAHGGIVASFVDTRVVSPRKPVRRSLAVV